jgi:hypothetical protein
LHYINLIYMGFPLVQEMNKIRLQYVIDPMVAKAFAARQGIGLCRELGYQCLQLEGYCKDVVNAIISDSISQVKVEPIIADIQE